MRVLVIGESGQLARALHRTMSTEHDVQFWGRAQLDMQCPTEIRDKISDYQPDCVVNASAYTAVDTAETEGDLAYAVNCEAVKVLGEIAERSNFKLVHISTDFVFDGAKSMPYTPSDDCNPLGVYGESKLQGERALLTACPAACIIRTGWLYGRVGKNFMTTMLGLMRQGTDLRVVCDQVGTPTSASHLAAIIWKAVGRHPSGTFHFSDAGAASWYDFACAIQSQGLSRGLLQSPVKIQPVFSEEYVTAARRPSYSVLDSRALERSLNWKPVHWQQALDDELIGLQEIEQ